MAPFLHRACYCQCRLGLDRSWCHILEHILSVVSEQGHRDNWVIVCTYRHIRARCSAMLQF
jgi:hypothetical protein